MTVHALFFCLRPDPATAARRSAVSVDIARRFGLRVRPPRTERLHVTLHHLGWYDDATDQAETMAEVRQLADGVDRQVVTHIHGRNAVGQQTAQRIVAQ